MEKFRKKSTLVRIAILVFTILVTRATADSNSISSADDEDERAALVSLVEFDYEDRCINGAEANWAVYNGRIDAFKDKMEADLNFGLFSKEQANELDYINEENLPELLVRRMHLMKMPGDTKLDLTKWNTLVSFSENAKNDLRNATNYSCDGSHHCTLQELAKTIATSRDEQVLKAAKDSWIKNLPDAEDYTTQILPLLNIAAKRNNFTSVEEYWEALAEYSGAYAKSREIWSELEPLYRKLHVYISLKLSPNGTSRTDGAIPTYMLGSLLGDDWINIADMVVPHPGLLAEMDKNLKNKNIGGREAYKVAAKLLQSLHLGDLNERFWRESVFNKTCPAVLVDFCQADNIRVGSCNDIGLANLIEAHEIVMQAKHKEIAAGFSANTYIIREANRYSALYEAVPGLATLLALTPEHLHHVGLLHNNRKAAKNSHHSKITLQMLQALRDLPRLNYYLTADAWRLQMFSGGESGGKAEGAGGTGWSLARSRASIAADDKECLGDPYIVSNKPYIGKFLGTVLKYQLLDSYTAGMYGDEANIVNHIASDNQKLKSLLGAGYSKPWPLLIEDFLPDFTLSAGAIINYFQPLTEFLDTELADPQSDTENDDEEDVDNYGIDDGAPYGVSMEDDEVETQAKPEETTDVPSIHLDDTLKSDLKERNPSEITEDENKHMIEATTFATLQNPNLIPKESIQNVDQSLHTEKEQEDIQQASTPLYVWIGLALVVAIVAALATVIARKRCQHRRELERERREGLKNTPA